MPAMAPRMCWSQCVAKTVTRSLASPMMSGAVWRPSASSTKAPQALDHAEGMLATGADGRAQPVELALIGCQGTAGVGTAVHPVADATLARGHAVKLTPVGLVPIQLPLLPMRQLGQLLEVRGSRIGGHHSVYQPVEIGTQCAFMPKRHSRPFFLPCFISGSRALASFFVCSDI
jgi:hypothetical protein